MQLAPLREIFLPDIASSQAEQNEAQLVKASQQGDQNAFALLVQNHQRLVFNMVLRMLQDYEEASEITQEAFFAAWQGLPAFRGEARFATWLYRIAYNCALKQLERRKRERSLQAAMAGERILEGVNKQKGTEDMLELHALQVVVREQVEKLPDKYRMVLILRHLQEKTYEEMARIFPGHKQNPIGCLQRGAGPDSNVVGDLRIEGAGISRGDDVQVTIRASPAQVETTIESCNGGRTVRGLAQGHFVGQMRRIAWLEEGHIEMMIGSHPCNTQIAVKDRQTGSCTHQSRVGEYLGEAKGLVGLVIAHQVQVVSRISARPAHIDRPIKGAQGQSRVRLLLGNGGGMQWSGRAGNPRVHSDKSKDQQRKQQWQGSSP